MAFFESKPKAVDKVVLLPVAEIFPNPDQPRKAFDQRAIETLAQSIQESGLLQPIVVRPRGKDGYLLVAGERRLRAFQQLGRQEIPAIIREMDSEQGAVLALLENIQRQDLNCFEEAQAVRELMLHWGISQQQLSQRLGLAQSTLANKLRLLKLEPSVQERALELGLTERHCRALLLLEGEDQRLKAVELVHQRQMTVGALERYIQEQQNLLPKRKKPLIVLKDFRFFLNTVHRATDLLKQAGVDPKVVEQQDDNTLTIVIQVPKRQVCRPREGGRSREAVQMRLY